MSHSYFGSVEVGPHWCGEYLFESVAAARAVADEAFATLRKKQEVAAMAQKLMRDNPGLDLKPSDEQTESAREAVEEQDRLDVLRSRERAAEIWAEIVPVTNRVMEELQRLPANYLLWALAQVVGDAIAKISHTKGDALTRANYLDGCIRQKLAEVFYHREHDGALRG